MPADLRDLFDAAVARPPAEPHTVADVVRRAGRSRRRRRVAATTGVVAAVGAVAASGALVAGHVPHGTSQVSPADAGVVGPVVHPDPGMRAIAGGDYDVVSRRETRTDGQSDPSPAAVTDDGSVVVVQSALRDPQDPTSTYDRWGLMPTGSDDVQWLPTPPGAPPVDGGTGAHLLGVAHGEAIWAIGDLPARGDDLVLHAYDVVEDTWRTIDIALDGLDDTSYAHLDSYGAGFTAPVTVGGNRIWFSPATIIGAHRDQQELYSAPLDGGALRSEGLVGDWAVHGNTLVSTDALGRPVDRLRVRDLHSGASRSFDPLSGDTCRSAGLDLENGRIALSESCGGSDRAGGRQTRVHVVSTGGRQIVTVVGEGLRGGALGAATLTVGQEATRNRAGGVYVYDFVRQRLLQVADRDAKTGASYEAGGSTITWATPQPDGRGNVLRIATWTGAAE